MIDKARPTYIKSKQIVFLSDENVEQTESVVQASKFYPDAAENDIWSACLVGGKRKILSAAWTEFDGEELEEVTSTINSGR